MNESNKVRPEHLRREAYLYIRQSSLRQVRENRESTARQYDLKRRAQGLDGLPIRSRSSMRIWECLGQPATAVRAFSVWWPKSVWVA